MDNSQVYLERILRKPEIDAFAEELKPHQVGSPDVLQKSHFHFLYCNQSVDNHCI